MQAVSALEMGDDSKREGVWDWKDQNDSIKALTESLDSFCEIFSDNEESATGSEAMDISIASTEMLLKKTTMQTF